MGWSIMDWTSNPDWSSLTNINDFIGAIRERQTALCQTPLKSLKNVGDDVQAYTLWRDLQQWVEDNDWSFVVSHDVGVKRAISYYDAVAGTSAPYYANLAAVFSAAGLSTSNWRRYTTHPDDGGSGTIGWQHQTVTFDANGETDANGNPLAEDTWHRRLTDDPATHVARPESSACLSSNLNFPNWCVQPRDTECKGFEVGWGVSTDWALIGWDVSGGFSCA